MAANYKIREVQIDVRPGIRVLAEVESVDELKRLISELAKAELLEVTAEPDAHKTTTVHKEPEAGPDTPAARMELRAGLNHGSLKARSVLAFKDGVPQLLRPNSFGKVTDAAIALLFAIEVGMKRNPVEYESFKAIYDDQNIKSGSPLPMLISNLKNAGYIDKGLYTGSRGLRLTAKGEKKAIEVLTAVCA